MSNPIYPRSKIDSLFFPSAFILNNQVDPSIPPQPTIVPVHEEVSEELDEFYGKIWNRFEYLQSIKELLDSSEFQIVSKKSRVIRCLNPQREHKLDQLDAFLNKIWMSCKSAKSISKAMTSREYKIVADESRVEERLSRQMQHCLSQMENEPFKEFHYKCAPKMNCGPIKTFRLHGAPKEWRMKEAWVEGYKVGISHGIGRRSQMNDTHLADAFYLKLSKNTHTVQLFGVFDGHNGDEAAYFVRDHLLEKLEEALIEFNPDGLSTAGIWNALKMTTVRLNQDFNNQDQLFPNRGTTATIAMILDQKIWCFNVGKSRIVLDNCGTPLQLTEDANPSDPRYKKGIEKRKGVVTEDRGQWINDTLGVARAMGCYTQPEGISARPKITVQPLSEIDTESHLILCSKGVYDVACTRSIVQAVHEHKLSPAGTLARNIVYSAYESGSKDNLTCMVVKLG